MGGETEGIREEGDGRPDDAVRKPLPDNVNRLPGLWVSNESLVLVVVQPRVINGDRNVV